MDIEDWEIEHRIDRIVDNLFHRTKYDKRYASNTLSSDIQEIYMSHKEKGVRLTKAEVLAVWKEHYKSHHILVEMRKKLHQLLRVRENLDRRIIKQEQELISYNVT